MRRQPLTSSLHYNEAVSEVVQIGDRDAALGPGFKGGTIVRAGTLAFDASWDGSSHVPNEASFEQHCRIVLTSANVDDTLSPLAEGVRGDAL